MNFRKEKVKNKRALQEELGLRVDDKKMMIGLVSRLTDQKGLDLIAYVMDELCQDDIQFVVLGTVRNVMRICSVISTGSMETRCLPTFIIRMHCPIKSMRLVMLI